ncbi:hypothetical protein DOY81_003025 [Sarcophaga bullata]|nr:hypothetical protein DOY81_003025 [Sarcophaga bullata]
MQLQNKINEIKKTKLKHNIMKYNTIQYNTIQTNKQYLSLNAKIKTNPPFKKIKK